MGTVEPSRLAEGSAQTLTSVVRVVPDVSGIDKTFDYVVPERFGAVAIGSIVRVELNGRRVDAWVVPGDDGAGDAANYELKPILDVLSVGPPPDVVDLAAWCAQRFAGPLRGVLAQASPPKRVKSLRPVAHAARTSTRATIGDIDALVGRGGGVVVWPPGRATRPVLESALSLGRTLVVCPGVAQARTIATALRREGLSVATMPDDWQRAAEGADVVVGARSAVWAPCPGLAAVVVLDEHDERLQDERSPTWHARDVAIERSRRANVPCLVVSPLPSVTAAEWAGSNRTVVTAAKEGDWPRIIVADPFTSLGATDDDAPRRGLVSSELVPFLRDASKVVACVLNVKGRARLVACRSCREVARCERCEAALHLGDTLRCPSCGLDRPVVCVRCGAGAMALVRKGVTRLREEIEAASGRPVREITSDSGGPGNSASAVYVGTEALLHRLDSADVVAFLDFDNEVFAPTYRAGEHAWALLVLAARLLRGSADPVVILQTNDATNPAIVRFSQPDPMAIIEAETATRRALGLPPFVSLARVEGGEPVRAVLDTAPLGVDVAALGDGRWLVRGADATLFARFCADLRRAHARVHVDPRRY